MNWNRQDKVTYGNALDSLRRYMVKEGVCAGITDVCLEVYVHNHQHLFKPLYSLYSKQAEVEKELKELHDQEAQLAKDGEMDFDTSSDESWRRLTSFAIPSIGNTNMYEYILNMVGTKHSRIMPYQNIEHVDGMHRKVLPWSFALKMMIEHTYGEWAGVICHEDQGRAWTFANAFFRLTGGTTTLFCHAGQTQRLYTSGKS